MQCNILWQNNIIKMWGPLNSNINVYIHQTRLQHITRNTTVLQYIHIGALALILSFAQNCIYIYIYMKPSEFGGVRWGHSLQQHHTYLIITAR